MLGGRLNHWAEHHFGLWAIAEKEYPEMVLGFGGLSWRIIDGSLRVNLGFRFAQEAWGKGYATENRPHSRLSSRDGKISKAAVVPNGRPPSAAELEQVATGAKSL
jgi:hypothetical protein